ncbi:hypothetical protein D5086_004419 [Populus alba]|uniref:Uncharacterized protein n=1 Tax=Populus alba TaxID=43335 RepID=A0ACC4CRJ9_POPAL
MNSVFSVDDFSDPFWLSPPPPSSSTDPKMNRSESEWAFENFLKEMASVPSSASETHTAAPSVLSQSSTSSIPPDNGEDEVRKQEVQARQTTSGSSREDSDDDDLEGDTGTNENMDPADVKRVRRMQSNRESARRSRRRKQAQLNELETQVGQLRDERTSLLSRFTDVNQKCDDAAVDNRILKADIETLRAKVKMAEEQVKRVTGLNPVLLARSSIPSPGMPFAGGQVDASTNVAVPMQTNPHQFFHQPVQGITPAPPHLQRLNNSFPNSTLVPLATNPQTDNGNRNDGGMAAMPSMQLTADGQSLPAMPSMQQVQKQIGPPVGPTGTLPACDSGLPHVIPGDAKKK